MPELTLDQLPPRQPMRVRELRLPAGRTLPAEWLRWLEEIGFIAGEPVMVLRRALPGGDPLLVRIGASSFALRRAEAACVRVEPIARGLG